MNETARRTLTQRELARLTGMDAGFTSRILCGLEEAGLISRDAASGTIRVVDHEVVRVKVKVPFDENGVRHLTDELQAPPDGGESSALSAASTAGLLLGPTRGILDQADARQEALLGPARGAKSSPDHLVVGLVHGRPCR